MSKKLVVIFLIGLSGCSLKSQIREHIWFLHQDMPNESQIEEKDEVIEQTNIHFGPGPEEKKSWFGWD